ncbi:unnamed protein product, partial [Ectocarpus sp. 6 AP-2014]
MYLRLGALTSAGWLVATCPAFVSHQRPTWKPISVNAKSSASETKPRQQWTAAPAVGPRGRRELRRAAQQREEPGSATAEVEAVGDVRRVYETWRWRGHNINYRVEGAEDAPPILLIHGFGASVGHFRKNIPTLVGEGYRVYAIDLLGFGASDKPKDVEFSLELWQEMLTDFISDKSRGATEQWVVMGNSIGGLLTLMLTEGLQEARKVRGSVLFNTAGGLVSFRKSELPFYLLPVMWFFNNVVGAWWAPSCY